MDATGHSIGGRRIVVVGASAGIGRAFATQAIAAGAEVVVGARREAELQTLVGALCVVVDVNDDDGLDRFAAAAEQHLGEIDLALFCVGSATLQPLATSDRAAWMQVLETNTVGFNQLAKRIVGVMAPSGIIAALSSESAASPREGLVAYAASKAALEASINGWSAEHPEVRWSCVAVGATFPTEFGLAFDTEVLGEVMDKWAKRGLFQEQMMNPDEVAAHLLATYASALALPGINVEHLVLRSPSPVLGTR